LYPFVTVTVIVPATVLPKTVMKSPAAVGRPRVRVSAPADTSAHTAGERSTPCEPPIVPASPGSLIAYWPWALALWMSKRTK
jgi:hypothetical protein